VKLDITVGRGLAAYLGVFVFFAVNRFEIVGYGDGRETEE